MKIYIDPFDKKSINEAIKAVKAYEQDFARKEKEFVRRLAEIGVSVASAGFQTADYDGINDVVVSLSKTPTGYAVLAEGSAVGFIEFGTGITNPEYDSSQLDYTPPAHGTYGKGYGARPKGWYYVPNEGARAVHTYGNAPAEAMLTARNVIIERVAQIAREVWK